jgi:hypothetical protein
MYTLQILKRGDSTHLHPFVKDYTYPSKKKKYVSMALPQMITSGKEEDAEEGEVDDIVRPVCFDNAMIP